MKTASNLPQSYCGTNAERLAINTRTLDALVYFYESDTGDMYQCNNGTWSQKSVNGAGLVTVGPASPAHNRNIAAANSTYARATNSASWVAGTHISYIRINPVIALGATPLAGDILGYAVINAPSEAVAGAWLADAGSASTDVQYKPIIMGTPCEFNTVLGNDFSGEIVWVDILPITTGRFIVEAN